MNHTEPVDGSLWRSFLSSTSLRMVRLRLTWQTASDMLAANTRNRHIRPMKRKEYADLMSRGLWTEDHPGAIAFTKSGVMFNGQHTLLAMTDAKVTLVLNVAFGCSQEAMLTVDGQMTKTLGDRLWISDRGIGATPTDRRRSGEVATRMINGISDNKNRLCVEDIAEFIDRHREAIGFTMQVFGNKQRGRITTAPVRAVIARAYYHVALDRLRRFVEVLLSGEPDLRQPTTNERAIVLARNWLIEGRYAFNSNNAGEVYRRVSRALQAYVNNTALKQLKDISYDCFPLPERQTEDGRERATTEADFSLNRVSRNSGQFGFGG